MGHPGGTAIGKQGLGTVAIKVTVSICLRANPIAGMITSAHTKLYFSAWYLTVPKGIILYNT